MYFFISRLFWLSLLIGTLWVIPTRGDDTNKSKSPVDFQTAFGAIIAIVIALDIVLCGYCCLKNYRKKLEPHPPVPEPFPAESMNKLVVPIPFEKPAASIGQKESTGLGAMPTQPIVGIKPRIYTPGVDKNLDPLAYGIGEEILRDTEYNDPLQRMSHNVVQKMNSGLSDRPTVPIPYYKRCECRLDNYNATFGTAEMRPAEFYNFMKTGLLDVLQEFNKLTNPPDSVILKKDFMKLGKKDRYFDIPVIEKTAVYIMEGKKKFYIHANRVEGFGHHQKFICCQAPLQNSAPDFWTMFWQSKSLIIVQLARFKETNMDKCFMYWPDGVGMVTKYGDIEVTNNGFFHREESFVITELFVKKGDDSRVAYHCFYLRWPDRSVPKDPSTVINFIETIEQLKRDVMTLGVHEGCHLGPPDIVHCSAGVGRTGTYCALQISIDRLLQQGTINIQAVVNSLREQRHSSVQEKTQYMFIYVAMFYYVIDKCFVSRFD